MTYANDNAIVLRNCRESVANCEISQLVMSFLNDKHTLSLLPSTWVQADPPYSLLLLGFCTRCGYYRRCTAVILTGLSMWLLRCVIHGTGGHGLRVRVDVVSASLASLSTAVACAASTILYHT